MPSHTNSTQNSTYIYKVTKTLYLHRHSFPSGSLLKGVGIATMHNLINKKEIQPKLSNLQPLALSINGCNSTTKVNCWYFII